METNLYFIEMTFFIYQRHFKDDFCFFGGTVTFITISLKPYANYLVFGDKTCSNLTNGKANLVLGGETVNLESKANSMMNFLQ